MHKAKYAFYSLRSAGEIQLFFFTTLLHLDPAATISISFKLQLISEPEAWPYLQFSSQLRTCNNFANTQGAGLAVIRKKENF